MSHGDAPAVEALDRQASEERAHALALARLRHETARVLAWPVAAALSSLALVAALARCGP